MHGTSPCILWMILIFLTSCSSYTSISLQDKNISYREAIEPTSFIPTGGLSLSDRDKSMMNQSYLGWIVEHDNLVDFLDQGRLAILESHRRAVGHLETLSTFLSLEKRRKLANYIRLYPNLLAEVEAGTPKRVMAYKYDALKQSILEILK